MSRSSLSRRDFIRLSCCSAAGAAMATGMGRFGLVNAYAQCTATGGYKALVCIFLFGGNDGNNTLIPFGGAWRFSIHPPPVDWFVPDFNDLSWFDRAGNFHSDALHVVERFTARDQDHLNYEATIEDPKVFTRPWKMSMPLYRIVEKNAQILEYKCVEFSEDVIYGHLYKVPLK